MKNDEDEAFEIELSANPRGYGQGNLTLDMALASIRHHGCWREATVVTDELTKLSKQRDGAVQLMDRLVAGLRSYVNSTFKRHCGNAECDDCNDQVDLRELLALIEKRDVST